MAWDADALRDRLIAVIDAWVEEQEYKSECHCEECNRKRAKEREGALAANMTSEDYKHRFEC